MIIYYFSSTGNSLKAAQDIARAQRNAKLIPIRSETQIEHHSDVKQIGFVFPVYMGVLPEVVERFIETFPVRKGIYYFAVSTYYLYKGVALSYINSMLKKKGVELNYSNAIPTVGNCLKEYEVPEQKRPRLLHRADMIIQKVAEEIRAGAQNKTSTGYAPLIQFHKKAFRLFFGDMDTKLRVEKDKCIGCGMCKRICPAKNITSREASPSWGNHCLACHACVHWCPRNAIYIGRSKGRLPYHHPGIAFKELL